MFTNMGEVSSSSAQRATSPFKEVGWRRCSDLERIQILCDVAKGCSTEEKSPSPVIRPPVRESAWPGVTTRPQSTPCGPPHGHGSLDGPGRLQHLLLLVRLTSSSLQLNCSRSGSATQAAVIVLYLLYSLGVMILTAQSLVPLECCMFFLDDSQYWSSEKWVHSHRSDPMVILSLSIKLGLAA